jgi:hypothetical protein
VTTIPRASVAGSDREVRAATSTPTAPVAIIAAVTNPLLAPAAAVVAPYTASASSTQPSSRATRSCNRWACGVSSHGIMTKKLIGSPADDLSIS